MRKCSGEFWAISIRLIARIFGSLSTGLALYVPLTYHDYSVYWRLDAGIAQLVEYKLPKLGAAGSNPVSRSSSF